MAFFSVLAWGGGVLFLLLFLFPRVGRDVRAVVDEKTDKLELATPT